MRAFGTASAFAAVVVFANYISSQDVMKLYSHARYLWLIVPFMILWTSRVWLLASRGELNEDPVAFALTDLPSLLMGVVRPGYRASRDLILRTKQKSRPIAGATLYFPFVLDRTLLAEQVLHLLQQSWRRRLVLHRHRLRQFRNQIALCLLSFFGICTTTLHDQIAASLLVQIRHTLAANANLSSRSACPRESSA